ncbi:MAG: phospholipase [Fermentimonas sp.]|jgi:hypothetical protein
MRAIFLFLGIILFFVVALTITNYIQRKRGVSEKKSMPDPPIDLGRPSGCCGAHEVCERDSLIAAFEVKPEYFDDEELDKYKNRDSASYADTEVDEFRDVFYSVLDEEKPKWVRSLNLRNISVPDQLKDEILMFVDELRTHKMNA